MLIFQLPTNFQGCYTPIYWHAVSTVVKLAVGCGLKQLVFLGKTAEVL
jgi:hypothetical protein